MQTQMSNQLPPLERRQSSKSELFHRRNVLETKVKSKKNLLSSLTSSYQKMKEMSKYHFTKLDPEGDIPTARGNLSAILYNTEIYIFGGELEDYRKSNEVYSYNIVDNVWKKIECTGKVPSKRDGHRCVVFEHGMYVYGGAEEVPIPSKGEGPWVPIPVRECCINTIYRLDLKTFEWTEIDGEPHIEQGRKKMIEPRREHSANMYGKKMIVFGGLLDEDCNFSNAVWAYDIPSNKWQLLAGETPVPEGPRARRAHSAVMRGNDLIIYGGTADNFDLLFDIYSFSLYNRQWTKITVEGDVNYMRAYHTSVMIGDSMYTFGGMGSKSDMYMLNFSTREWKKIYDPRQEDGRAPKDGRFCHIGFAIGNEIIIFGGEDSECKFYNDIYLFNTKTHLHAPKYLSINAKMVRTGSLKKASEIKI